MEGPYCYDYPRPAVTVDAVVFDPDDHVLLIQRKHEPFQGRWALPGGFVEPDEPLDAAVIRELAEETGVRGVDLHQVGAFGDPGRDPRGHVVSIAYATTLRRRPAAAAADDAADAHWFPVAALPPMAFDHDEIVATAAAACGVHRREPG
jgi:8-oxo-dGTP diphosphatase